jgi:hypothetical protein
MSKDCPTKPPMTCKNCGEEGMHRIQQRIHKHQRNINANSTRWLVGHILADCKNARKLDRADVADVPGEEAWADLERAILERDVDDAKIAIQKYVKVYPEINYVQLQEALYEQELRLFLIANERQLLPTYTNMDLQGNLNKKYTVSYRFSDKPDRPREKEGWPTNKEEILARLADAGEVVPNGLTRCSNCSEVGHISKNCPQEKIERTDKPIIQCYNCGEVGHRVRDCKVERKDRFGCKNCGKSGHMVKECTEPRSAEGVECRKCGESECPHHPICSLEEY